MALSSLVAYTLLGCLAFHGAVAQVTPANYLLTTAHNLVNLDALKAANPGKCCIPLPGGPASVAFMNTDLYYVATKSDCTDKLTVSQYPAIIGFVWACGCKGGPCNSKGGRIVVPPGNTCGDKNGPFTDHICMLGTTCQQHGTQYRCRLPCGFKETAPFYLNTTGHKIMLSDLKAKAGTTCCYKIPAINDRVLYLSTKNAYVSGDAECKSLYTVATYPLSFTYIWLCGCPGGDCAQSKKLSSTIGGNTFTPPGLTCGDAKGDWLVRATCAEGHACGRMSCDRYACQPYSFKYPTLSCPAQPFSTCNKYVSLAGTCGTMAAEDPTLCCAGNDLYCGPGINGQRTCRDPYIPFCNDALVLPSPKPSPSPIPKPSPSPSPRPSPVPSPAPVPKPCACPRDYRPVCYNNKEYPNICEAKCANPGLKDADAKPGPCPKVCPCPKDYRPVCYNNKEYANICLAKCEFPALKDADAKPGPCPKPCACPKNLAPVCVNGKEFSNICLAKCAIPGLKDADAKPGPCPKVCACPKNLAPVCYNGKEFSNICLAKCEFPALKDADAKPGPCPKVCACPRDYRPVCARGKTFSNICEAKCLYPDLKDADAKSGACVNTVTTQPAVTSGAVTPRASG